MLQRQKRQKSPSFIVKTPFKSIAEHRKVRELQRKMNIEEVEEPTKNENLQTKPALDPFKSTAEHRKVRELPRKMNIEEVDEPETTKICRQNPRRQLRNFTDETNMQARNHKNSDEFRAPPVRHLDLDTPAFYYYRKNPKCYHTVWGTTNFLPLLFSVVFSTGFEVTHHWGNRFCHLVAAVIGDSLHLSRWDSVAEQLIAGDLKPLKKRLRHCGSEDWQQLSILVWNFSRAKNLTAMDTI